MTVMHVLTLRAVAQSMKPAVEMANWLILFMSLQFFCNLQVNDFFLYNVNSANMFSNCLIVIIFRTRQDVSHNKRKPNYMDMFCFFCIVAFL